MPPSLPWPDSFTPPNGVSGVETAIELTPTIPDSMASPIAAAALLGVGDKTFHGIDAACVRHRPHGDALFQTVAELDAFRIIGEARDEFLVGVLLHVEAAWRDADLAGVAVLECSDRVGGLL